MTGAGSLVTDLLISWSGFSANLEIVEETEDVQISMFCRVINNFVSSMEEDSVSCY